MTPDKHLPIQPRPSATAAGSRTSDPGRSSLPRVPTGSAVAPVSPTSHATRVADLLSRTRTLCEQISRHVVAGDAQGLERDSRQLQATAAELHGTLSALHGRVPESVAQALAREFAGMGATLARVREQTHRRKALVDRQAALLTGAAREPIYRMGGAPPRH